MTQDLETDAQLVLAMMNNQLKAFWFLNRDKFPTERLAVKRFNSLKFMSEKYIDAVAKRVTELNGDKQ